MSRFWRNYESQPRTSHSKIRPKTAEPMPITRKVASGAPMTEAIERFAGPGKAAKTRPSITNTNPNAARKSVILRDQRAAAAESVAAGPDEDVAGAPGAAGDGGGNSAAGSLPDGLLK
jgi:hypothetical protein